MKEFYKPDHDLSPEEAQDAFVFWAYARYHNLEEFPPRYRRHFEAYYGNLQSNTRKNYDLISELYVLGKVVYQALNCDYTQFEDALLRRHGVYPGYEVPSSTRYPYSNWYIYHGVDFHQPLKYVRNPLHAPRVLDEAAEAKLDWREHKGFERDYRRRGRSGYGKRKGFAKQQSNRLHRQMERTLIDKEKWDEFSSVTSKYIFDAWMWD